MAVPRPSTRAVSTATTLWSPVIILTCERERERGGARDGEEREEEVRSPRMHHLQTSEQARGRVRWWGWGWGGGGGQREERKSAKDREEGVRMPRCATRRDLRGP